MAEGASVEILAVAGQPTRLNSGKIEVKISSWLDLSSASITRIERVFLLVVPKPLSKYDAREEEKKKQEAKQAELQRLEESKRLHKDKGMTEQAQTLMEKLVPQIANSRQVCIRDVHIRYEDTSTCPRRPFSVGLTLHSLSAQNIDTYSLTISMALALECLAVYWNCYSSTFPASGGSTTVLRTHFHNGICTSNRAPRGYTYVLGPINTSTKLHINPQAGRDIFFFSSPLLLLDFAIGKLPVALTRDQYREAMELLDEVDRRKLAAYYRKYHPHLTSYRGHYKHWWRFAFTCVMEEVVHRRRRNWSWWHMRAHRRVCRDYAELYRAKLKLRATGGTRLPEDQQELLDRRERDLDLTNIVLIRRIVELEEERKQRAQREQVSGWLFSWQPWWATEQQEEEVAVAAAWGLSAVSTSGKRFGVGMTQEEKAKLCQAIDFREDTAPPEGAPELSEMRAQLTLSSLRVKVPGGANSRPQVSLEGLALVSATIERRPAESGFSQKQRR